MTGGPDSKVSRTRAVPDHRLFEGLADKGCHGFTLIRRDQPQLEHLTDLQHVEPAI